MQRWRIALCLLAVAGYALLSQWLMLRHPAAPWALAALLGPLWLSTFGLVPRRHARWGHPLVAAAGIGLGLLVLGRSAGDVNRLYLAQHLGINLLLGAWFAASLLPGRTPLIGGFARRVHGTLSFGMQRYTRRLTGVWVAYFGSMAALSAAVYATRPFDDWTVLCNLVTPLSVAALFAGEHALRYRLHPEFERATMAQAIRASRSAPAAGRASTP